MSAETSLQAEDLDVLFEPVTLGRMEVRNRIAFASAERRASDTCFDPGDAACVHEGLVAMYAARARGGVGLVILEDTDVDSDTGAISGHATSSPAHPCLDRDLFIPSFKNLTDAIHAYGAKIVPNLRHLGMIAIPRDGGRPLAPSGASSPLAGSRYGHMTGPDAKAASLDDIRYLQEKFASAAFRAKRAGFDGVQIAGHHGFLISQFLSPRTNKRTDEYGGSLENRMRFAVELIDRVRNRVGRSFTIIFALSGDELVEGGLKVEESALIAQTLERAGVDAFHVVPGVIFPFPNGHRAIPAMGEPFGVFTEIAHAIKKAVRVPVIANGRIKEPHQAARIILDGKADLISMTRSLISDPDWANKALRGQLETIRPCIACNYCIDALQAKLSARCTVNAEWGRESEPPEPAHPPKKVVVIGGGPAGLEAARTAALRGHHVALFEQSKALGGQLRLASVPPGKDEIRLFMEQQIRETTKLPIEIHLGTRVDWEKLKSLTPEVVILATGASPVPAPASKGASIPVLGAWEVLSDAPTGQRVVVAGGGATGCEVAEHLAARGKQVTVIEMEGELARDMNPLGEGMRHFLLERIEKLGVTVLLNTKFAGTSPSGVEVSDPKGQTWTLPADTAVVSIGVRSAKDLDRVALRRLVPEVYLVGDCSRPRTLLDAIWEGSFIGREI